jgi:hypothetical protein
VVLQGTRLLMVIRLKRARRAATSKVCFASKCLGKSRSMSIIHDEHIRNPEGGA